MPLGRRAFGSSGRKIYTHTHTHIHTHINAERKAQFNWALQSHAEYIRSNNAPLPRVIITVRELALINALKTTEQFCLIPRLLCKWHVNMNVLAKSKRHFPPATKLPNGRVRRNARFASYLGDWNSLLDSATEDAYEQQLARFTCPGKYPAAAVNYAVDTWLRPYKEQLVACWVNKILHWGHRTTSIVESSHPAMKKFLCSSGGDLATVFTKLKQFWAS
jgi:hypothetical protein